MFSGIIETTARLKAWAERDGVAQISLERPSHFNDLHIGDSVAVDGVCLTVEKFTDEQMFFALGPETLRVTEWHPDRVIERAMNVERSLRFGDRIHGHLVTGHVDALGRIVGIERSGESTTLRIALPNHLKDFVWAKGSVAVNGVSLTINRVEGAEFWVGLIPETLKRTNLGRLQIGDPVNLEIDNMARGLVHLVRQAKMAADQKEGCL